MIGLDTNVLVRYFTYDDAAQSAVARKLIDKQLSRLVKGHVSLVTLAELTWLLRSRYKAKQVEILTLVETLLAAPHIDVQDENAVWVALDDCSQPGVGFADALIAACNQLHGCTHTVTFDVKASRIGNSVLLI